MLSPKPSIPALGLATVLLVACASAPSEPAEPAAPPSPPCEPPPSPSAPEGFSLTEQQAAAVGRVPELAAKLAASPYALFRFQHGRFSARVCEAFEDVSAQMPIVNLHGDAHLEQYAVTLSAHGLDDFDEAGYGPAVVDLVRFVASLHLACDQASFPCDPERASAAFLARYRETLLEPDAELERPRIVDELRKTAPTDQRAFLAWGKSLMKPVAPDLAGDIERAWQGSAELMLQEDATQPASFFALKSYGRIDTGIGSALSQKFLLRIAGPTDAPDDDLLVEVKQQAQEAEASCVYRPPTGGVLYPQLMQLRLGRIEPQVLAFVPHVGLGQDKPPWMCWIHSWDEAYQEVSLSHFTTQDDLDQVARDVGHQLGRGHCRHLTAPFEGQHRRAEAHAVDLYRGRILSLGKDLSREVITAWKRLGPLTPAKP